MFIQETSEQKQFYDANDEERENVEVLQANHVDFPVFEKEVPKILDLVTILAGGHDIRYYQNDHFRENDNTVQDNSRIMVKKQFFLRIR